MPLTLRAGCRIALAVGLLVAPATQAQGPTVLPLPAPVAAATFTEMFPRLTTPVPDSAIVVPKYFAGSAGPYAVTPQDEPQLPPGAGWDQLPADAPGWFGAVTVGVVRPHVSGQLTGDVTTALPFASPGWSVMPRVEVGYRLANGEGDLRLGYHFLAATGSDQSFPGGLHTRVELNAVDLDYVSSEWLVEPTPDLFRDLRAVAGIRLADGVIKSSGPVWNFRSEFVGAGPRFGLEWRKPIPAPQPLEFYIRAEGSGLIGHTRQTIGLNPSGPWQGNGAIAVSTEVGFGWRPTGANGLRILVGYQFEQWWNLSRTDSAGADLSINGVFIRGEWRY